MPGRPPRRKLPLWLLQRTTYHCCYMYKISVEAKTFICSMICLPRSAGVSAATTSIASGSSSELLAYATMGNKSLSALIFIAKNEQKGNLEKNYKRNIKIVLTCKKTIKNGNRIFKTGRKIFTCKSLLDLEKKYKKKLIVFFYM